MRELQVYSYNKRLQVLGIILLPVAGLYRWYTAAAYCWTIPLADCRGGRKTNIPPKVALYIDTGRRQRSRKGAVARLASKAIGYESIMLPPGQHFL
jgi:hypothetical protein